MDLKPSNILRKSVHTFLQNYLYFTSIPSLLVFPFAAVILLSQILIPSSSLQLAVFDRIRLLFNASGFPSSSEFFMILDLKFSQTISSTIFSLPFTLTFLLFSKASVIHHFLVNDHKPLESPLSLPYLVSIFRPLFVTYICNIFVILSANATAFFILFFSFNFLEEFNLSFSSYLPLFSASGLVIYSIIFANVLIVCNLSLVLSGMERSGGFISILKACVLIRGRASTALLLALPVNLLLAGIEALFQYRILRNYHVGKGQSSLMALEGMLIAYLYSVLLVLDTVVSCIFYRSCKKASDYVDQEQCRYSYRIEIAEADHEFGYVSLKVSQELP